MRAKIIQLIEDTLGQTATDFIAPTTLAEAKRKTVAYAYLYLVEHSKNQDLPNEVYIIRNMVAHNTDSGLLAANLEGLWRFFRHELDILKSALNISTEEKVTADEFGCIKYFADKSEQQRLQDIRTHLTQLMSYVDTTNEPDFYLQVATLYSVVQIGELQYSTERVRLNKLGRYKDVRREALANFKTRHSDLGFFLEEFQKLRDNLCHPDGHSFDEFVRNKYLQITHLLQRHTLTCNKFIEIIPAPTPQEDVNTAIELSVAEDDAATVKPNQRWQERFAQIAHYIKTIKEKYAAQMQRIKLVDKFAQPCELDFQTNSINMVVKRWNSNKACTQDDFRAAVAEFQAIDSKYHATMLIDMFHANFISPVPGFPYSAQELCQYIATNKVQLQREAAVFKNERNRLYECPLYMAVIAGCDLQVITQLLALGFPYNFVIKEGRHFVERVMQVGRLDFAKQREEAIFFLLEDMRKKHGVLPAIFLETACETHTEDEEFVTKVMSFVDVNEDAKLICNVEQMKAQNAVISLFHGTLGQTAVGVTGAARAFINNPAYNVNQHANSSTGETPLHVVCGIMKLINIDEEEGVEKTNMQTVPLSIVQEFLDKRGAEIDPNLLNYEGYSPLGSFVYADKSLLILTSQHMQIYLIQVQKLKMVLSHPLLKPFDFSIPVSIELSGVTDSLRISKKNKGAVPSKSARITMLTAHCLNCNDEMVVILIDTAKRQGTQQLAALLQNFMQDLNNKYTQKLARQVDLYLTMLSRSNAIVGRMNQKDFQSTNALIYKNSEGCGDAVFSLMEQGRRGVDQSDVIAECKSSYQRALSYVARAKKLLQSLQTLEKFKCGMERLPEAAAARLFAASTAAGKGQFKSLAECANEIGRLQTTSICLLEEFNEEPAAKAQLNQS